MLLVVLLAGLAGFVSARLCDRRVLLHKLFDGVEEFTAYLDTCELVEEQSWILEIICMNSEYGAVAAVLEKLGDVDAIKEAYCMATKHGRFDILKALVEDGYGIFFDFHHALASSQVRLDHMEVAFFSELEANFEYSAEQNVGFRLVGGGEIVSQDEIEILYCLIGQGFDIRPHEVFNTVFWLDLSPGDLSLSRCHCEFAYFLMERTEKIHDLAILMGRAVRFENGVLIGGLLEIPQVLLYLQLVKYAAGALLAENEAELVQCLEPATGQEGDLCRQPPKIEVSKLNHICDQFQLLIVRGERERALLEPLTPEDVQLVATPQSSVLMKMVIFLLKRAY